MNRIPQVGDVWIDTDPVTGLKNQFRFDAIDGLVSGDAPTYGHGLWLDGPMVAACVRLPLGDNWELSARKEPAATEEPAAPVLPKPAAGQFWAKRDLTRGTVLNYSVKRVVSEQELRGVLMAQPFAELFCLETGLHDTFALTSFKPENGWKLLSSPQELYELRLGEAEAKMTITLGIREHTALLVEIEPAQKHEAQLQAEMTKMVLERQSLHADGREAERKAVVALLQEQVDFWRGEGEKAKADATAHCLMRIENGEHIVSRD